MGVEKILEGFLKSISPALVPFTQGQDTSSPGTTILTRGWVDTYGNFREILEGTLLPSIVHKALASAMQGIIRMRGILHVAILPGILTGEMKEAGGAMVSENATLIEFEASESACQALAGLMAAGMGANARRQGLDTRDILWCARRRRWLGGLLCLG